MTPPRQRLEEKQGKRSLSLSADELCFGGSSHESEQRRAFRVLTIAVGILCEQSKTDSRTHGAPVAECENPILAHVLPHCAEPSPAFCAVGKRWRRRRRDGFSRLDPLPMDDGGPLSPKANAFSIASLISAAEQAGNASFDKQSAGLDKPDLHNHSSFKMHYSTVTREMEGKSVC